MPTFPFFTPSYINLPSNHYQESGEMVELEWYSLQILPANKYLLSSGADHSVSCHLLIACLLSIRLLLCFVHYVIETH
jgi:hypothetical protein